jgi:hypothetical protein
MIKISVSFVILLILLSRYFYSVSAFKGYFLKNVIILVLTLGMFRFRILIVLIKQEINLYEEIILFSVRNVETISSLC